MKAKLLVVFVALTFITNAQVAYAVGSGGYENASFGAKALSMGNAFTAQSDDPSAISFNPAGLTDVPGTQVQFGTALINPNSTYKGTGDGAAFSERGRIDLVVTPNVYVTHQLPFFDKRFSVGFGVTAPFGLVTEYSSTGPFRYIGFHNELAAIGTSLVGAVRLTDWLSVGASAIQYRTSAKFHQKMPLALVVNGTPDALAKLEGDGTGWGWNLGVKVKPHPKHTIGVYYRSPVRTKLDGTLRIDEIQGAGALSDLGGGATGFGGSSFETRANQSLEYPENITVGYLFTPNDRWKFEADIGVTGWHVFDRQVLTTDTTNTFLSNLNLPTDRDFKDVISVHFGTEYQLNEQWALRAGYIFFQSPQTTADWRPDIADSNRNYASLGVGYKNKKIEIDFAYTAIFFNKRSIHNGVGSLTNSLGGEIDGNYKTFVNEFMVSFTLKDFSFLKKHFSKTDAALPSNQ